MMTLVLWLFRKRINKSGLRPSGHAVLLEPYEPEIKASLLVIPEMVRRRTAMVEMRATVIDHGSQAWRQEAYLGGLIAQRRARVGEKVVVSMYCGAIVQGTADGKQYRYVNDEDIFSVIESEDLAIQRSTAPHRGDAAVALADRQEQQATIKELANG